MAYREYMGTYLLLSHVGLTDVSLSHHLNIHSFIYDMFKQ